MVSLHEEPLVNYVKVIRRLYGAIMLDQFLLPSSTGMKPLEDLRFLLGVVCAVTIYSLYKYSSEGGE